MRNGHPPNGPQTRAMRRDALLAAMALLATILLLATMRWGLYLASQRLGFLWVNPLTGGASISPFRLDRLTAMMLFLGAVAWYVLFFDRMLCHGVSRRSFATTSGGIGLFAAIVSTVLLVPLAYVGTYFGSIRLYQTGHLEGGTWIAEGPNDGWRWVNGWLGNGVMMGRVNRFANAWVGHNLDPRDPYAAIRHAGLPLFLLACVIFLAMMIAATALGMLAGAALMWVLDGGTRRIVGMAAALLAAYAVGVLAVLPWMEAMRDPTWSGWVGVLSPLWVRLTRGDSLYNEYDVSHTELALLYAWLPLIESLLLFAVCAVAARRLAARHEVHSVRLVAAGAGGEGKTR
ncbi:hypothetical protein [Bifidobacterium platyrrhinorum]|uniref:Uncharacterized protein n=1 Tax=Bifidobacterium platyrrhinorum TaxID=2661628 RepID=A0A6L9SXY9_9BIFI|nr:hypothetical protein [Bifidobacterium platyrrhinorum]NEG55991.1 hypothetical protein [Bifidobacterium platyrrhinorum]